MKRDGFDNIGWSLLAFFAWIGILVTPTIAVAMFGIGIAAGGPEGLLTLAGGILYALLWPVAVVQLRIIRHLRTQMGMN